MRRHKFLDAHTESPGQFVEGYDGRISASTLQTAEILLADSRKRLDLLLRQAFLPPQAPKVPAHQLPHVHAERNRSLHTMSLSTIMCIRPSCASRQAARYIERQPSAKKVRSIAFTEHTLVPNGRNTARETFPQHRTGQAAQPIAYSVDAYRGPSDPLKIRLTPREREVLIWAARGKTAWETAKLLELSERTVKAYISSACVSLGAQNKTHAVAICLTHGVFDI